MSLARRAVLGLALASLVGACQPTSVVVQNAGVPDQPTDEDRVGPAIIVAQGNGPLGQYRAWIYRITDGSGCFELATEGMATTGCGPGAEGTLGIAAYPIEGRGTFVGGGTDVKATTAVVHTPDGGELRTALNPAPAGLGAGMSYFIVAVPGAAPGAVDLLDDQGQVLETIDLSR